MSHALQEEFINEQLRKMKILVPLFLSSLNTRNYEMIELILQKKRDILHLMLEYIEDRKENMSEGEYLFLCNELKSVY